MRVSARVLIPAVVLLMVGGACDRKPTFQAKFEPMYRTAKTVQASTGVGVSYQQLGELLQKFATEVSIAADRSETPDERALVAANVAAFEAYKDSHAVWNSTIQSYSLVMPELQPMVSKYKIPVTNGKFDDDAIQVIWAVASEHVNKATALYYQKGSSK